MKPVVIDIIVMVHHDAEIAPRRINSISRKVGLLSSADIESRDLAQTGIKQLL